MTEPLADLTDESFDRLVGPGSGLWLVDFWAQWCAPCHALASTLAEIAGSGAGDPPSAQDADADPGARISIGKVDVSVNPGLEGRFEIRSLPTIVLFRDGVAVRRLFGAKTRRQLLAAIASLGETPPADLR